MSRGKARLLLDKIRHPKKRAFLAAFAETGNVSYAAKCAGIDRTMVYVWLEKDEQFALAKAQCLEAAVDALELEARRRAIEGVRKEKPVYYRDELLTTVVETEFSDTLLIFLLKGARPEKYRERIDVNQAQPIVKVYEGVPWEQV